MAKQTKQGEFSEPRINDEISGYDKVRLIYRDENGEQVNEIVTLAKAKWFANKENELDLIEINSSANPPIVKMDNYSKWLYNEKKKAKDNKQKKQEVKEIQLSANIGKNDIDVKVKHAKEFIENGDKVKVILKLKGREITRREESKKSLYEFLLSVEDFAIPESMPRDEGNRSIVILKKKK